MKILLLAALVASVFAAACGGSYSCMSNPDPQEDPNTGHYCGDTPTPVTTGTAAAFTTTAG